MNANLVPSAARPVAAALCMILTVFALPSAAQAEDVQISIEVAPSTINLASDAEVVTVHTSIAYSEVVGSSVILYFGDADVPIAWWKSDARGYFVAKFPMAALRDLRDELVIPGENTFGLDGYTGDGDHFFGEAEGVAVIDGGAQSGGGNR